MIAADGDLAANTARVVAMFRTIVEALQVIIDINIINLFRIKKLLTILFIDSTGKEQLEQIRVNMIIVSHETHDADSFG